MRKAMNNNMMMHGFILVTILATAKSIEAEITMEAAFQGHCGHTSPCEQLCYEIHDGMYECDCIEGYELNKNGYSCQVINATSNTDTHSKSDEDVLYQKGASFSAKLANSDRDNQFLYGYLSSKLDAASSSSSSSSSLEEVDDDESENFFGDDFDRIAYRAKLSSNDYYISSENFNQSPKNGKHQVLTYTSQDVPESKPKLHEQSPRRIAITATTDEPSEVSSNRKSIKTNLNSLHFSTTTTPRTIKVQLPPSTANSPLPSNQNNDKNYYSKPDMSIYDDVNNNQLNLRPFSESTYQDEYAADASNPPKSNMISKASPNSKTQISTESGILETIPENLSTSNISGISLETISYCNLDCGAEGVCEINDGNCKCLCPFGKTGRLCLEDNKIHTPKFAKHSWIAFPALRGAYKHVQVRVEFRPEAFDGIILLSGERDDLTGDFMALLLNKGFVEFWFDCGSGVGNVRSRETILLNEWNSVIIYRHRWDAWLVLNHGTKVQGRSNGLFSRITFREPVFLGGTGNITGLTKRLPVFDGFVGCIRRFVANEHEYKFQEHPLGDVTKGFDIQDCISDKCFKYPCKHGGKCLPTDEGAICLCPIGFVGDLCEIRMDLQVPAFNGSSYLRYAPLGDSALIWLELKVILKPQHQDGLILYSGPETHGDFIALLLSDGYVEFVFDLGSGPAIVRSEYPLSVGQWHSIKISRTARLAVLKVDQYPEVMTVSSNGFWHLSLPENLFVGGVNHVEKLPLNLKSKSFFIGCIQKVHINGHSLSIVSEALGGNNIANCPHACVARPCGPFAECIPQMESYECRCNAFTSQCAKATEVPLEELNINKVRIKNKASKGRRTMHRHNSKLKNTKSTKHPNPFIRKENSELQLPDIIHFKNNAPMKPSIELSAQQWQSSNYLEDDIIFQDEHDDLQQKNRNETNKNNNINNNDADDAKIYDERTQIQLRQRNSDKSKQETFDQSKNQKSKGSQRHESVFKLNRLPTHYESFQSNPDSDILIFDENVELQIGSDKASEKEKESTGNFKTEVYESYDTKDDEYNEDRDNAHDKMNEKTKSEPNTMDETLLDVNDENNYYHRKELVQVMERIMANSPNHSNVRQPDLITGKYNYEKGDFEDKEYDSSNKHYSDDVYRSDADGDDIVDDVLLQPVQSAQINSKSEYKVKETSTPQTHTDWSLLKKLELSADHQSQFTGVRKNFGACFAGENSYFHYNDAETMSQVISYNIDLNLRIKTHSRNGVILWTGRQSISEEDDDFLSLGIEDGFLHFRYDLGSGDVNIKYNVSKVSDGLWHRVRAIRNSQVGYLEVDGRKTPTLYSPGKLGQLNTDTGLYVGGMPDTSYFTRRKYSSGIVGCISEIVLAGQLKLNFDPNTLGTAHNVETGLL